MLRACPSCSCYFRHEESVCPHCRAHASPTARTATALLLGLALTGCFDKEAQALYGMPVESSAEDLDGDGWAADEDCDDANAEIHPEATETAGDGVDSNCDGEDDT